MSVRLKRAAARLLAPTGMLRLRTRLQRHGRGSLLILGYHRILPLTAAQAHAGDLELISATPGEFAWQVGYLARRFELVGFEQIADAVEGGRPLPQRAAAITFDDGFQDLYDHALPVLAGAGATATVFICTDYIGSGAPMWFDLVAYVLLHAPLGSIRVPGLEAALPLATTETARREAAVTVLKWLKSCSDPDREAWLDALRDRFADIVASGEGGSLARVLDWEEIAAMAAAGIEFGSHTAGHRCLARLSDASLEHELRSSRRVLEERLGRAVTALAYPFGGPTAFDARVIAAARAAGYRIATSYMPGINRLHEIDRYCLLRQHVERDTSRAYFEALVNLPEVFT
jgi:peptidoglycan/xylan/chitin deacetylase (PgdA/CDA1 family)